MPHTLLLVPRDASGSYGATQLTDDALTVLLAALQAKGVLEVTDPNEGTKHLVTILACAITPSGIEATVNMTYNPDTGRMTFDGSGPMDFLFEEPAPAPPAPKTTIQAAITLGTRVRTKTMPNPRPIGRPKPKPHVVSESRAQSFQHTTATAGALGSGTKMAASRSL